MNFASAPAPESERRERVLVVAPAESPATNAHTSELQAGRPGLAMEPTLSEPDLPSIAATAQVTAVAKVVKRASTVVDWLSARIGAKKDEALRKYGGDETTEAAVAGGLKYLASIQRADGSWGSRSRDKKYGRTEVGVTALVSLAFLGAGHYPGSGTEYEAEVTAGLAFLLERQMPSTGHFGRQTAAYAHGIATYAIGEAYLLSKDERLLPSLRVATQRILVHQELDPDREEILGGWGYYYHNGRRFDGYPRISVSVWQIMALKTAKLAGVEFDEGHLDAARFYLANSWSRRLERFLYTREPERLRRQHPTLPGSTPAAMFGLLVLDHPEETVPIEGAVAMLRKHGPGRWREASTADFVRRGHGNPYYWYYGTLALFLHGGEAWYEWNDALKRTLLPSQESDGSWEPISVYSEYAGDSRNYRAYTTALNVLMLEVYYRYLTPFLRENAEK